MRFGVFRICFPFTDFRKRVIVWRFQELREKWPCWVAGWLDAWGWMDGWMDEWMDGWVDGWME